jgi:membrane-associated phospholipid phosphatase
VRTSHLAAVLAVCALLRPGALRAAEGGAAGASSQPAQPAGLVLPARAPTLVNPSARPMGPRSPFRVRLAIDLPVTIVGFMGAALPLFIKGPLLSQARFASLSPTGLNALDRTVVGNDSPGAGRASDALLGVSLALPFAAGLLDWLVAHDGRGLGGFAEDSLVVLETLAINLLLCDVVKFAVRRPRPYLYNPGTNSDERLKPDAALSFYSGHTAMAFAMATSYSYLFSLRHPHSPLVPVVWAGTYAVAATVGIMRVEAGKHFWTDVLAGAAVGSATGFLVPWLHRRGREPLLSAPVITRRESDGKRFLRNLRVAPQFPKGGVGVSLQSFW